MTNVIAPSTAVSAADWTAPAAAVPAVAPAATAAPASPAAAPVPPPSLPDPQEQARIAAQQLQEYLRETDHELKFSIDEATGMTIVRIYNSATGELVRQIPSAEIVHIAEVLRQEAGRSTLSLKA